MSICTPLCVGLRVVRGPDWKWQDQDGGEGHAGTIVEIGGVYKPGEGKETTHPPSPRGTVILQWDTGVRTNYRVGHQNAYDLRVLDSAPTSINHPNIICKTCLTNNSKLTMKSKPRRAASIATSNNSCIHAEEINESKKCDKTSSSLFISGIRWTCSLCSVTSSNSSYDICTSCYMSDKHDVSHPFWRIESSVNPLPVARDYSTPFKVPENAKLMEPRNVSKKITLKGLFPGCKVVRGQDWNWSDQDGGIGKIGKVLEIHGWDSESERSVATVLWPSTNIQNVYRLGHKGKVDLKVPPGQPAAVCGTYYPDHLPVLGRPQMIEVNIHTDVPDNNNAAFVEEFDVGDMVKINVSVERLRCLQDGHSGFNPRMSSVIGQIGRVHRVTGSGDVRVQYKPPSAASENPANYRWTINPLALRKVSAEEVMEDNLRLEMEAGRIVKVLEDEEFVRALQSGHGEWIPRMKDVLGKTGQVIKVYDDGDVRVEMTDNIGLEVGNTLTFNPACLVIQTPSSSSWEGIQRGRRKASSGLSKNNNCGSPFPALTEVQVDSVVADAAHGNLEKLQKRFDDPEIEDDRLALESHIDIIRACIQAASQHGKLQVVKFLLAKFPSEVDKKHQGKTALHVASHQGHLDVVR